MKKKTVAVTILIVSLIAACRPTPTAVSTTPTGTATIAPVQTSTPTPTPLTPVVNTMTPTPTGTHITQTPGPVATPQPATWGDNLFDNPGFEGATRAVVFGEVNVFTGWEPFYCDDYMVAGGCSAERQGDGNPYGLMMGRPEYKPARASEYPERVHDGSSAQQWFCFYRACRAGVYQTIDTVPGARYRVGAYVQSWSTGNANITGWQSQLVTDDDRANSRWQIAIDLHGGIDAFSDGLLRSRDFTFDDGIYDQYVAIGMDFTAIGNETTVFFQDTRLWPFPNNDSYIDDAWIQQRIVSGGPTATPEPTPTRISTYTDDDGHIIIAWCEVIADPCVVSRIAPGIEWERSPESAVGYPNACYPYGADLAIYDLGRDSQGALWLSPSYEAPTWIKATWCQVRTGPNGERGWFEW